jgi:PAS domain S-box-containing protein
MKRRILIVDDTEADRAATRFLLEHKRANAYSIQEVDQGKLAAEACEKFQPDCVLLDYRLPDMDGLEVLDQLRRQFGAWKFAVVLQTGLGHETLAVRALKSGAQDYLPKGELTGELLDRAIQNALEKVELERRKHASEQALLAKQGHMHSLLAAAPCALYTADLLEGRSTYVSETCRSLIGYTPEEVDQMGAASFLALIHPDDRATVQGHARALRLAGDNEILECQFRLRHKDGTWRWLSTRDRIVARDSRGFGTVAAGAATATSGRTTLGNVSDAGNDFLAAQEAAGMAAFAYDLPTQTLTASPLFGALYGRPQAAPPHHEALQNWIHADDRSQVADDWARALNGEPLCSEFRSLWPDGSIHWLRAQGKRSGTRLLGLLQDITEDKTRQETLRAANEELERFAYIASHDLQEPLRAVISFGDLLFRKSQDMDAGSRQCLDFIRQAGARMQALVSDLLTFSRVLQADQEVREPVDCQQVLTGVQQSLLPQITESGARIEWDPLPVLQANPQQMAQLFENLLSNAIKFRDDRPPLIRISAERAGTDWRFCVSDNGIGFEMIYAARIFEAFKRLHGRSQYPGSGIGLALCKKIVERHGGRIWAESDPGAGSKFWFLIRAE